jgi:peptidyl-prolyl cis-trans isomerase C
MKSSRIVLVGALLLTAACNQQGDKSAAAPAAKPVATVNGVALSRDLFEFFVKSGSGKAASELTAEQRSQALDTLVRAELVAQQASKDGLDKQGDAPQQLAIMRLQVLEQAAATNFLKDRKATDAETKAEYDSVISAMPKTEFHAHHILVKSKEEADALLAKLKKGAKFEALASAQSADPGSKANGGDLGWFSPSGMVKEFSAALATLKKGQTTAEPVKSEYGWHIIRLDDTRETAPPPFDTVKERLAQRVEAKKFKTYEEDLLKAAKVDKTL